MRRATTMYPLVIEYTSHARKRLYERNISEEEVLEALEHPDEVWFDTWTNRLIAVSLDTGVGVVYIQRHSRLVVVTVMRLRELNHVIRSHRKRFRKISYY